MKSQLREKSGTCHSEIPVSYTTQEYDNVPTPYHAILQDVYFAIKHSSRCRKIPPLWNCYNRLQFVHLNFYRTKPLTLSSCSFRSLAMVSSAVLFASSSSVQLLRTSDRSLLRTTIYRNNQHTVKHVTFWINLQSCSSVRNGDPPINRDFSNANLSVRSGSPLVDPSLTNLLITQSDHWEGSLNQVKLWSNNRCNEWPVTISWTQHVTKDVTFLGDATSHCWDGFTRALCDYSYDELFFCSLNQLQTVVNKFL